MAAPGRAWLAFLVMVVCLTFLACDGRHGLAEMVPRTAAGVAFDHTNAIDDSFLSGHAVDDVYAALGVTRSEALAISRLNTASGDEIGAIHVPNLDGARLLDAFVDSWRAEAIAERSAAVVGDRQVSILHHRAGDRTYVYQRGNVVFYAYSEHGERAARFVPAMP